ncbi:MAG: DUF4114 domain-containing protein, partial [Synechococcaceae cyanobacterium]|nr:DUF4114 domain-containing protein [Synechococcaceae cyanobacterium]
AAPAADSLPAGTVPAGPGTTTPFADGLLVDAFTAGAGDPFVRFRVRRQDDSRPQAISYATTAQNGGNLPGRDHQHAAGVLVFRPGERSRDILVPLIAGGRSDRRGGALSLAVEAIPFMEFAQERHVLLDPLPEADNGQRPVLSGVSFTVDPERHSARLDWRADTNNPEASQLRLRISGRDSAADLTPSRSTEVLIRDFNPAGNFTVPLDSFSNLPLDHDARRNRQVSGALELSLSSGDQQPGVSLLGPALIPSATVQRVGAHQIRFSQDGPLTTWRTDSGSGRVSFGLQAGVSSQLLLSEAVGGSAGSINPAKARDDNPEAGWQGSEGLAVGSRSITSVANLTGPLWTPTASREGVALALLEVSIYGNQISARFEGDVQVAFWQAGGTAPTLVPMAPALEVQRLAGYRNWIGLYSVDGITGTVDGRNPGDADYLQVALARSEAEKLLLSADDLPGFGDTASFNSLPIDTRKRYGVLLLQDGDRSTIFSSFSAANPAGETQMVRLGSDPHRLVLGIEDIAVASGRSDRDFNDHIVSLSGVSLALF